MQKLIIKEVLKSKKITQSELAERLGLQQPSLARTLSSKTAKGISVSLLLKIADLCCCDVREFFSDVNTYEPRRDLKPIVQRAGGKSRELHLFVPHFPHDIENFYDIFCGGGSCFLNAEARHYYANDISKPLINLYEQVKERNPIFIKTLKAFEVQWQSFDENYLFDIPKLYSAIPPELQYGIEMFEPLIDQKRFPFVDETAVKSVLFVYYRYLFNNSDALNISAPIRAFLFFFMSQYCFSGMQRVNGWGEFTVPYAGKTYNRKSVKTYLKSYQSDALHNILDRTTIGNMDFEAFLTAYPPTPDDFVFVDSPYTSKFSTYDQTPFTPTDHERLADYLLNKCACKWMVVINDSDFIRSLYSLPNLVIRRYNKKYSANIKNRFSLSANHLVITNY